MSEITEAQDRMDRLERELELLDVHIRHLETVALTNTTEESRGDG